MYCDSIRTRRTDTVLQAGGELLLDAISTFTATELLSYNDFVALTVIAGAVSLGRVELKKKVRF